MLNACFWRAEMQKRRSGSCQIGFESCAVEVGRGALVGASEMGWMGGG
jgi:hypothetical protein